MCFQRLQCLQVASKLPVAEAELGQVRSQLQQAQRTAAEVPILQEHLRAQDRAAEQAANNWARERALMERQLAAAGRERDQLSEQVAFVIPKDVYAWSAHLAFGRHIAAVDELLIRSCNCGLSSCRAAALCVQGPRPIPSKQMPCNSCCPEVYPP